MQWERCRLEARLNADFSPEQREELFQQWAIALGSPKRKRQLIERLWSPDSLRCRLLFLA